MRSPWANERGESILAASQAGSVRARSVRRPKSSEAAFLSPMPFKSGPNFSSDPLGSSGRRRTRPPKDFFSVFGERLVDANGRQYVLGRVEVAQLVLDVCHDVPRFGFGEVVAGHPGSGIERLGISQEREQPAPRDGRSDLGELRCGAVSFAFHRVTGDAPGFREEFLSVGGVPAGSSPADWIRRASSQGIDWLKR